MMIQGCHQSSNLTEDLHSIDARHSCRITTRQADGLMDKRLVVAIDSWPADSAHPLGHYVRTLGMIGDKDTETVGLFWGEIGQKNTAIVEKWV
jgi:hypothetical protein